MTGTVVKFPVKVCAMCGGPAVQSVNLVDEYGALSGKKHLCDKYPDCKDAPALPSTECGEK